MYAHSVSLCFYFGCFRISNFRVFDQRAMFATLPLFASATGMLCLGFSITNCWPIFSSLLDWRVLPRPTRNLIAHRDCLTCLFSVRNTHGKAKANSSCGRWRNCLVQFVWILLRGRNNNQRGSGIFPVWVRNKTEATKWRIRFDQLTKIQHFKGFLKPTCRDSLSSV